METFKRLCCKRQWHGAFYKTLLEVLYYTLTRTLTLLAAPMFMLLGFLLIVSSPLLMATFHTKSPLKKVFYYFAAYTIIPLLSWFLDTIPTWLMDTWWLKDKKRTHISQDGKPVLENVAVGEYHTYGDRRFRENVQALQPFRYESKANGSPQTVKHVLYIHGGGFIAANSKLLMPSITPIVRKGYTIWCANYPLSPWNRFPTAISSILSCLQWLKREKGVSNIAVIGDSAGGSIATMASVFATNRHLLDELYGSPGVSPSLTKDPFPVILGVVSLYGVLDQWSWRAARKPTSARLSALENQLSSFGLEFCVWAYRNRCHPMDETSFLCEIVKRMKKYPKTLLVVGDQDILVHSSRTADRLLRNAGFDCHLSVYKARHAFVGLPPALNLGDEWKRHSAPATTEVIDFLSRLDY